MGRKRRTSNMPSFEEKAIGMAVIWEAMKEKAAGNDDATAAMEGFEQMFSYAFPEPNEDFIKGCMERFAEAGGDENTELSFEQAVPCIIELGKALGMPEPSSEEEAFAKIDEDGNGKISLEEFGKAGWLATGVVMIG